MPQRTPLFCRRWMMVGIYGLGWSEGGKSPSQINKVGAYSVVTQWEPRRWGKHVGKCLDLGIFFWVLLGDWFSGTGIRMDDSMMPKNCGWNFSTRNPMVFSTWA